MINLRTLEQQNNAEKLAFLFTDCLIAWNNDLVRKVSLNIHVKSILFMI